MSVLVRLPDFSVDVPADARWCVVRWTDGVSAAILAMRGTQGWVDSRDPVSGASFCGPISKDGDFPSGEISASIAYATRDDALVACCYAAREYGPIACDIPTPVEALHFSVKAFDRWKGETKIVYDGGSFEQARTVLYMLKGWVADERATHVVASLECRALHDRLKNARPTAEMVARMNEFALRNRSAGEREEFSNGAVDYESTRASIEIAESAFASVSSN